MVVFRISDLLYRVVSFSSVITSGWDVSVVGRVVISTGTDVSGGLTVVETNDETVVSGTKLAILSLTQKVP